jgi:hypothetical protein
MAALSTWAPEDGLLGAVAPLGLAAIRDTALVIDLDEHGPRYQGSMTLARLVESGPRRADLEPTRRGTALLANGGIAVEDASDVLAALVAGWPDVVMRLPARDARRAVPFGAAVVPFRLLLPVDLLATPPAAAVWQSTGWRVRPPGPGPVLPRPAAATVASLLGGVRPGPARWLRRMRAVWEHPWR